MGRWLSTPEDLGATLSINTQYLHSGSQPSTTSGSNPIIRRGGTEHVNNILVDKYSCMHITYKHLMPESNVSKEKLSIKEMIHRGFVKLSLFVVN